MIYLFCGTDEIKSRDKYNAIIDLLQAKSPEATLFRVTNENFKIVNFEELTRGQGLFHQKIIVACDNLLSLDKDNKAVLEVVDVWLDQMAKSENIFIFLENNIDEKILSRVEKIAVKTQKFEKRVGDLSRSNSFNIFSLTDAFTARNKNRAWLLYQEALYSGFTPEEILWKLIWSVNNLLLVKNTKDSTKLKMKPFPLTKAKAASKTFSNEELKKISAGFVDLYHNNFLGTDEFDLGLEKIILGV